MAFKCFRKILRAMSQITWKKRLVFFILFIGSFLVFNNFTGKVSGYNYTLISVQINGKNVLGNSNYIIQARLHSNLFLNVTWCMYYNPALEGCSVEFLFFNNKSLICNSTQYSDIGSSINHFWSIPLSPQNWSLDGGQEYGHITVLFDLFDGLTATTKSYAFPVLVLPEELNCTFTSISLENDTSGRMKQLDLLYSVRSLQDPLYIHQGLGFTCIILDINNNSIGTHDFFVNNNDSLNVTISKQDLIGLENNSFTLKSFSSNYLVPVIITGKLNSLIHRVDIILYFKNITETKQDGGSSISLFFKANATQNNPGIDNQALYFTWQLLNESSSLIDNGSIFVNLSRAFSIPIKPIFINNLENLCLQIWFEGNFRFKEKGLKINLDALCSREDVNITLINQQELQRGGYGDLVFKLQQAQTSNFLADYQTDIEVLNIINNSVAIELTKITDSQGCFNISLSQKIMRDLESYEIRVTSVATLAFRESINFFTLKNLFSRAQLEILMKNGSTLSLTSRTRNILEFKLNSANYNESLIDGNLISLNLVDESNRVIDQQYTYPDSNGLIEYEIPVDNLTAGQNVFVNIYMNATFIIKQLTYTEKIHIQAINKENGNSPNQMCIYSLSISLPVTCIFAILFIFRRHKKQFLSKESFKISVK